MRFLSMLRMRHSSAVPWNRPKRTTSPVLAVTGATGAAGAAVMFRMMVVVTVRVTTVA
jgi:uncharacterized membrane protein